MTCILGFTDRDSGSPTTKAYLCADSQVSSGLHKFTLRYPKFIIRDTIAIGYSGNVKDIQLFQYADWSTIHPPGMSDIAFLHNVLNKVIPATLEGKPDYDKFDDDGRPAGPNMHLLIAYRGALYTVDSSLCVLDISAPWSVSGSGTPEAIGIFSHYDKNNGNPKPGQEFAYLNNIMDTVCHINTGCSGPYNSFSQEYNPKTGEVSYYINEIHGYLDININKNCDTTIHVTFSNPDSRNMNFSHIPKTKAPSKSVKKSTNSNSLSTSKRSKTSSKTNLKTKPSTDK